MPTEIKVKQGRDRWNNKENIANRWCWRRLFWVPWTARRSNKSILKETSPGCSLEGLMLTETPILWPPHEKSWLTGKDPDAGRDWGQEKKGTTEDEVASRTRCTWVWVNSGSWWWTGRPGMLRFMGSQSRTRLSSWTEETKHSTTLLC